jgi:hypothetical protein
MTVAALLNIPTTQDQFNDWSFAHAAHHRDCIRAAETKGSTGLNEFILDPVDLVNGFGQWIYTHQTMHNQMNAALGTEGFDLTDTNWQDQGEFAAWIQNNENEHYQWATVLGVG